MITEEKLMAYADGELTREDGASLEAALPEDEQLKHALEREQLLRSRLSARYDPVLEEEVPERLTSLLTPHERRVTAFATHGSWWQNVTAIAATLVLGIFVGQNLGGGTANLLPDEAESLAQGRLAEVLDTQLASAQAADAPIQVGISFIGPEGAPCRTFQSSTVAGLACRSDAGWDLMLLAPERRAPGFEYQQAGSASALVMGSAQELMVGEPMDAVEERRSRDTGWRPVQEPVAR